MLWTICLSVLLCHSMVVASWGSNDRIKLTEVQTLTLYKDKQTTSRRSYPVPQLKCVGGSAGCNAFTPYVVQCSNKGSDGYDVQWECKTDMDNAYRFGRIEVVCEGYDHAEDPYILKGSCGLEYTLDNTKEGQQNHNNYDHNYYGNNHHGNNGYQQSSFGRKTQSFIGNMILIAMVALLIYGFYKTCLADRRYQYSSTDDDGSYPDRRPWFGGNSYGSAPPPGFRPEYSGDASCGGNRYQSGSGTGNSGNGFWTGAATGGLLGYLFGSRNSGYSNYGYGSSSYGYQPRYQQPSSGWDWGSSSGGGGGSGSTGTRTASGFGGTRRR